MVAKFLVMAIPPFTDLIHDVNFEFVGQQTTDGGYVLLSRDSNDITLIPV